MSWKATSAAKDYSESRSGMRLLMLVIADSASEWGMAWQGLETLAHGCRVDPRTVSRNLGRLEELGELALFPRRGQSTVYVMTIPGLRAPTKQERQEFVALVGKRGEDFLSGVTFAKRNVHRTLSNQQRSKKPIDPRQNAGGSKELRNTIWDALADMFGTPQTRSEKSARGKVVTELVEIEATPSEIAKRLRLFNSRFPGATATPFALVKHWSGLQSPQSAAPAKSGPPPPECAHGFSLKAVCEECEAEGIPQDQREAV